MSSCTRGLDSAHAVEGARNCAISVAHVKRGDSVLIVTDSSSDFRIAELLALVCKEAGAKVTTVVMEPRRFSGEDPPETVSASILRADVIFSSTFPSIHSTRSVFRAIVAGARFIPIMPFSVSTFSSQGARVPAATIFRICKKLLARCRSGKTIYVRDDRGTDLQAEILKPEYVHGGPVRRMRAGDFVGAFAGGFGVVHIWPAHTSSGTIFFDCVDTFPGLPQKALEVYYRTRKSDSNGWS